MEPVGTPSTTDGYDEASLVAGLRQGDDAAYEWMVREYLGRLLAVARRIVRNEDDAQDAVQDAFVMALRSIDGFKGDSKLSTWLHRITVNAALMKLRSRKRRPEKNIEDMLPHFSENGHRHTTASAWGEQPVEVAERRELFDVVRQKIDELPENYRTVLVLRDLEELDTRQTAEALELGESAVKVRLHRARQALRELLDNHLRGGAA